MDSDSPIKSISALQTGKSCIGYKDRHTAPRVGHAMALVNVQDIYSPTYLRCCRYRNHTCKAKQQKNSKQKIIQYCTQNGHFPESDFLLTCSEVMGNVGAFQELVCLHIQSHTLSFGFSCTQSPCRDIRMANFNLLVVQSG